MKFDVTKTNMFCKASDTDSIFFTAEPVLLKKLGSDFEKKFTEKEIIDEVQNISHFYELKANEFLNKRTKELFNIDKNRIEFKSETIIKTAYFSGKRRYAQHIVRKEGIDVDEIDLKGIDIMKSNMTPIYRNFGKQLLINILHGVPKQTIDKSIIDFRKSLKQLKYTDIAKPTGVKKIREYIAAKPPQGMIFSHLGKKCPINTKASIYYNDLLRFKGLSGKYQCFLEGDKMFFIKLKPNPYKIDVLGFRGDGNDPEFIRDFLTEYADMDEGFESIFLNKLQNIYDDIGWSFPSLNENVSKFFNFV